VFLARSRIRLLREERWSRLGRGWKKVA